MTQVLKSPGNEGEVSLEGTKLKSAQVSSFCLETCHFFLLFPKLQCSSLFLSLNRSIYASCMVHLKATKSMIVSQVALTRTHVPHPQTPVTRTA